MKHWWKKALNRFTVLYFGRRLCNHPDVEVITAHPVTLAPARGICRVCKRGVRAITVWKDV